MRTRTLRSQRRMKMTCRHGACWKRVRRSSAEAELYAAALGASELKGIVSLLRDLGYERKPVLAIDAKATEHILHRQGIGKLKHMDVAYLWRQDEVRSRRLQVADLGTKPLSKAVIAKHCLTLGYVNMRQEDAHMDRQSWGCSGTSVQQAAGDHVQKAVSSEPQQRKQAGQGLQSTVTGGF